MKGKRGGGRIREGGGEATLRKRKSRESVKGIRKTDVLGAQEESEGERERAYQRC